MTRKYRDKRWLKNKYHYEGLNTIEIGKLCGVNSSTISKWVQKLGLEVRNTRGPPELKMPRWLEYHYCDLGMSTFEIGDKLGVTHSAVASSLNDCDIETRGAGSFGRTTKPEGKKELECATCGDPVYRYPSRIETSENHFCDFECRGEYDSQRMAGANNPAWAGGYNDYYGENWERNREKTLERDGYRCRSCGITQEEHYDKYDRDLEVHHVVPVRKFNDPADANSLGNLVTACMACHRKFEGMGVFPNNG